jgi:hypothetical protein
MAEPFSKEEMAEFFDICTQKGAMDQGKEDFLINIEKVA